MNRSVPVSCYRGFTRVNHWVAASCMIVLLISGFSFFHPSLFWMTNLFGGCQMTRWLHPIVGLLLVASFFLLLLQMWKLNLPRREDLEWSLKIGDVLKGNEENLPELGKYNVGQKVVFWGMSGLIVVLVVTSIMNLGAVFPQRGLDPGAARRTGIENVRYAACAGCAIRWNEVRVKCLCCGSTQGISYRSVETVDATVKAEVCRECKSWVKIFYQVKNPSLDPVADDVGSPGLDILMKDTNLTAPSQGQRAVYCDAMHAPATSIARLAGFAGLCAVGAFLILAALIDLIVKVFCRLLGALPLTPVHPAHAQDQIEDGETENQRSDKIHKQGQEAGVVFQGDLLLRAFDVWTTDTPSRGSRVSPYECAGRPANSHAYQHTGITVAAGNAVQITARADSAASATVSIAMKVSCWSRSWPLSLRRASTMIVASSSRATSARASTAPEMTNAGSAMSGSLPPESAQASDATR